MMAERLQLVVAPELPPPPYPADTRAGNYAINLDVQRVHQSATFLLAPDEIRPWLVFLWIESWAQIPMASLPDDDAMICALLRVSPVLFAAHRATLLRGWRRHADGRLYHDYLTSLTLAALRQRSRFKRHREKEASQPIDNPPRNVAALLPQRADVDLDVDGSTKATTKTKSKTTSSTSKGSRMPEDMQTPEPWSEWVVATYGVTPQRATRVFIEFRDFWCAVPGHRGLKSNWLATFKNRCRSLKEQGKL